ncbi:MAG TPA: hypothetical protein DEA96_12205 [Leptospiraceae bacterium]|nr:hypothetical protein [Leptospiraceae bacterium]
MQKNVRRKFYSDPIEGIDANLLWQDTKKVSKNKRYDTSRKFLESIIAMDLRPEANRRAKV